MNKAFTIVELLVASALATVLMVGVLHVVGSIKHDRVNSQEHAAAIPLENLVHLLAWDLTNARTIVQKNGKIVLEGYCALDRDVFDVTRDPTASVLHEPVVVEYSVWKDNGHSWLTRRQTHLNDLSNRNAWTEVVCRGVAGIQLAPVVPEGDGFAIGNSLADAWFAQKSAVPDAVNLIVELADTTRPRIEQMIILR